MQSINEVSLVISLNLSGLFPHEKKGEGGITL